MKPLLHLFRDFFTTRSLLGNDKSLKGLVKADALLQDLVQEKKVPGIAISVTQRKAVLFQKGYGYADLIKKSQVDPHKTVFRIASVSKPIAAMTLAKLVSDGVLDLDASIQEYVPYFPLKKYNFSLRQLAGHTAGIRGYQGKEYALNVPYSIKEGIAVFADDPLVFEPGTDYLYNSYDWCLLSLAMQEATGTPFEQLVAEKVLRPLGMEHTFPEIVNQDERESNNALATFYSKNRLGFREAIAVNNFYKLGGGGYLSTSADIARFGNANYQDLGISDEVQHQFLSSGKIKEQPTYYGLGWQVSEDKEGRPYHGHVGNGVGGYANFYVYPDQEMVFSILINCTDPQVQEILDEVVDTMVSIPEETL